MNELIFRRRQNSVEHGVVDKILGGCEIIQRTKIVLSVSINSDLYYGFIQNIKFEVPISTKSGIS